MINKARRLLIALAIISSPAKAIRKAARLASTLYSRGLGGRTIGVPGLLLMFGNF